MNFFKLVEDNELFDLRALRLDWFRVQSYSSSVKTDNRYNNTKLNLFEHRQLASQLDTISHHTRMIDYLDEMLVDTSDLSLFWYVKIIVKYLKKELIYLLFYSLLVSIIKRLKISFICALNFLLKTGIL